MHKEKYGILNILEFVHTKSANTISADIVLPSNKGFIELKTYIETNLKNCNANYKNLGL
jgi:hypothetical protein